VAALSHRSNGAKVSDAVPKILFLNPAAFILHFRGIAEQQEEKGDDWHENPVDDDDDDGDNN
jgi:hypothetical protein